MARTLSRRRSAEADEDYSSPDTDEYNTEDEDERPSRRRGNTSERSSSAGGRGWAARKKVAEKASEGRTSDKDRLTVKDEPVLTKFLEDAPFFSWLEHWVNEVPKGEKNSHVCPESLYGDDQDDCPLCEVGHPVSERSAFNVAVFDDKGNATTKYWIATPDPMGKVEKLADKKRTSPLNRDGQYIEIAREQQKNKRYAYEVTALDEDQAVEDYKIEPLTDDEIDDLLKDAFKMEDVIVVTSRKDLQEVVEEYLET